jgi:hypothetical protein
MDNKTSATTLYSCVMEETGRLGVNLFIDNGCTYIDETEPFACVLCQLLVMGCYC